MVQPTGNPNFLILCPIQFPSYHYTSIGVLRIWWFSLFGTNNQLCREKITKKKPQKALDQTILETFGNFLEVWSDKMNQEEFVPGLLQKLSCDTSLVEQCCWERGLVPSVGTLQQQCLCIGMCVSWTSTRLFWTVWCVLFCALDVSFL